MKKLGILCMPLEQKTLKAWSAPIGFSVVKSGYSLTSRGLEYSVVYQDCKGRHLKSWLVMSWTWASELLMMSGFVMLIALFILDSIF